MSRMQPTVTLGAGHLHPAYPRFDNTMSSRFSRSSEEDSYSDDGSVGPEEFAPLDFSKSTYKPHADYSTSVLSVTVAHHDVAPKRPTLTVDVLTHVMTYLPLQDLESARVAGPVFQAAAARVAPKPFVGEQDVVFVRWEPQAVHTALSTPKKARPSVAGAPAVFPWRCLNCGTVTAGPRSCGTCRAPLASSACRVFLGQLRKDLSAELAMAMIRSLAPSVTVLHMESHTNGIDGRGKGCAWAYVNSVEDAMLVTTLHKRVFVDLDADSGEGFWYIMDDALKPNLNAMAEAISTARGRPVWLPRQPLVAELPSNSMIAEYVRGVMAARSSY